MLESRWIVTTDDMGRERLHAVWVPPLQPADRYDLLEDGADIEGGVPAARVA